MKLEKSYIHINDVYVYIDRRTTCTHYTMCLERYSIFLCVLIRETFYFFNDQPSTLVMLMQIVSRYGCALIEYNHYFMGPLTPDSSSRVAYPLCSMYMSDHVWHIVTSHSKGISVVHGYQDRLRCSLAAMSSHVPLHTAMNRVEMLRVDRS